MAPLREMLGKEEKFKWTQEREDSYQELHSLWPVSSAILDSPRAGTKESS